MNNNFSSTPQLKLSQSQVWGIHTSKPASQSAFEALASASIESVANYDPLAPPPPSIVSATEGVEWPDGQGNVDMRPFFRDGVTGKLALLDSGSAVTVTPKTPGDKLCPELCLKAANNTSIPCYGYKEIEIRIGRKTYRHKAAITDIAEPIVGFDFMRKHKVTFLWGQWGDLYLHDQISDSKTLLQFKSVPHLSRPRTTSVECISEDEELQFNIAFEVACIKSLEQNTSTLETLPIQEEYKKLIQNFPGLLKAEFKATESKVQHYIETGSHPPCRAKMRPLMPGTPKEREGKKAWQELVDLGIVEPIDVSKPCTWASALHLQAKPSGGWRVCGDFRQRNSKTELDKYPLPHIKKWTHKIRGATMFSKVDMKLAFHHIDLAPSHRHKTTTSTPWGAYQWKKLPMGLANSAQSYQRWMDSILAGLPGVYCYLDDCLIYSKTKQEHKATLKELFRRLEEAGLTLALKKCVFEQQSIDFLGYRVSPDGIVPMPKKDECIQKFPHPEKQKDLLGYLGCLNYFRASLGTLTKNGVTRNCAEILQPLYQAATIKLKSPQQFKIIWQENKNLRQAFEDSKELLLKVTELAHPDPNAPLSLTCDASGWAVGSVLQQYVRGRWEPLGFFSKHLPIEKTRWTTYRRELWAILMSMRHFHEDFWGKHLVVWTDHRPICESFKNPDLQLHDHIAMNWLNEIGMHTYDIRHIAGKKNACSDLLSRPKDVPLGDAYREEQIATLDTVQLQSISPETLAQAQKSCPDVANHRKGICPSTVKMQEVKFSDEVTLLCEVSGLKPRPLLPLEFREKVIQTFHHLDHRSKKEVRRRTANVYYWPKMAKDINKFCKTCHGCQSVKTHQAMQPGIGKFPMSDRRFGDLSCDVVGPLIESHGYKFLFTIIDGVTKWTEAIPMSEATSMSCADAFINGWVTRFGVPSTISSDNGQTFIADLWRELQKSLDVEVKFSPLYRPQANGLIERQHRAIKDSLKASLVSMGDTHGKNWYKQLPWTMLGHRVSFQEDLGASPVQLTLGTEVQIPGALVGDMGPGPPLTKPELQGLLETLQTQAARPTLPNSRHNDEPRIFMNDTEKATHVYVRNENPKSMRPRYSGPFLIVDRPSDSTIQIKTGNYVSGRARLELHSWARCKPAYLRSGAEEGSRPKLGRPSKIDTSPNPSLVQTKLTSTGADADNFARETETNEIPPPVITNFTARENSNAPNRPQRTRRPPERFDNRV